MGLFTDIIDLFRERPVGREQSTLSAPSRGGSAYDLVLTSTRPALCVATVYRCVKLLSESVAQLPIRYERMRDGVFVPAASSSLNYLLTVQPDTSVNAFDFWAQAVIGLLMDGNAYIVPVRDPVSPTEYARLVLCGRGTVSHDTVNDIYHVNDMSNGLSGDYDEADIIHLKGLSGNDPKTGVSVLTYARLATEIASVGDSETKKRFATGGNVRGIVGNDKSVRGFGEYQDRELAKTARSLDTRFNVDGERIVETPGAVSFEPISQSSADMQFLESRKFTVREICRFFGVHPSFVFDDTSNNYKSAEMANAAFLSNTLNPILRKIEIELLRKLVPRQLADKRRFVFDRRELNACDLYSRAKYQEQTIATGIYTVNEWRAAENKPSVEGGDRVLVSANLKGIDETTTHTDITDKTDKTDEK